MLKELDARLEICLRRLRTVASKHGGRITYDTVKTQLAAAEVAASLDILDYIYDHLSAAGVSISDNAPAPDLSHSQVSADFNSSSPTYYRDNDATEPYVILPCSERAIDRLLETATEGVVDGRVFQEVLETCSLSEIEIQQLKEYLQAWGLDIPEENRSSRVGPEDESPAHDNRWGVDSELRGKSGALVESGMPGEKHSHWL